MEEITFIIGLPGSGKSTLLEYYQNHPNINYKVYDDWLDAYQCLIDINELLPYNKERRVALDNLEEQEDIIYKWWRTGQ